MDDQLASRVIQALSSVGASAYPCVACRLAPDSHESATVDVLALFERVRRHGEPVRSEVACVSVSFQLDAEPAGEIVAVAEPETPAARVTPVAGAPSRGVLSGEAFRFPPECEGASAPGLDFALAALDDGVSLARTIRRAGEEPERELLSSRVTDAVRASAAREYAVTLDAYGPGRSTCCLRVELSVLVVSAPLFVYAPATGEIREASGVAVPMLVSTHRGPARRVVDVVSASALEAFCARLASVAGRLGDLFEDDLLSRLDLAATGQRAAWRALSAPRR